MRGAGHNVGKQAFRQRAKKLFQKPRLDEERPRNELEGARSPRLARPAHDRRMQVLREALSSDA